MTWLSYFVKFGSALFILPLVLIKFSEAEIAVWFLFTLILSLSLIADSGFGPTIIRATSYYYVGLQKIPKNEETNVKNSSQRIRRNIVGVIVQKI